MATTAELQSRLAAVEKAKSSGALIVRHGDTMMQFRTLDEMDKIIDDLKDQIASAEGTTRRRPRYIKQCTKGL